MFDSNDLKFMQHALDLSLKGIGLVNPNPMVGAVIVKNGVVIGEGYHAKFGEPHAEVNAVKNAAEEVEGSTIYVTLEPCNHQGKTPPCTELLIRKKFSRIVIAMKDPNSLVDGKGIKRLRENGIQVDTDCLSAEAEELNKVYRKFITNRQPYCVMKTAMTLDGKIATYTGDSKWISNEESRRFVHQLRHQLMGIMVGVNTVIKDDPELTDRSEFPIKNHPVRIVVDSAGRTPLDSRILDTSNAPTIIAVTDKASQEFKSQIIEKGARIIDCPQNDNRVDLPFLFSELAKKNIDSVLLEGGSTLNFSAIDAGLVDKVYSFISPKFIGGNGARTPIGGKGVSNIGDAFFLDIKIIKRFEDDIMIESNIIKK